MKKLLVVLIALVICVGCGSSNEANTNNQSEIGTQTDVSNEEVVETEVAESTEELEVTESEDEVGMEESKSGATEDVVEEPDEEAAETKPSDDKDSEDATAPEEDVVNNNQDGADADGDGVVTPEEQEDYISPAQQACIDAGYLNPVKIDDSTYAMLTDGNRVTNGKVTGEYLTDYLASIGLQSNNITGGWISIPNGWYWFIAKDCTPIE